MNRKERLLEIARTKNKTLLIESFDYSIGNASKFSEKVEILDTKLKESIQSEDGIECFAIVRNIPVSHYKRNRNDREYSRPVWQNVAQAKSFENGFCLADHAEEEGSVTRIAGVWKNFVVRDDAPYADLYVLDNEHGRRIIQILKVKGRVGFSTVGFGELDENNSVIPESFEISEESVCDHVLVPSAGVFATNENLPQEDEKIPSVNEFLESVETNNRESNNTANKEGENKEGIIMDKELQESVIKNNTRVTIKEALSNSSKAEAIRDLKEFQSTIPSHMKESIDKVESAISRIAEELDKEVKTTNSALQEATKTSGSLTEKLKATEKLYEDLRSKHQKAIKVIESYKAQAGKSGKVIREAKRDVHAMYEDIKMFRKERFAMLEDIAKWLIKEGRFSEAKGLIKELKTVKERNAFASRISKYLEKATKRKENFGAEEEVPMEENDFIDPLEPDFFGEPEEEFVMVDEEPGATDPMAFDTQVDPTYDFQGDSLDAFEGGFEEEGEEEEGDFSFEDGSEVEGEEMEIEEEDEMEFPAEGEFAEDEYEVEAETEDEFSEEDEEQVEGEDELAEEDESDEMEVEDEEEMEEEYTSPDSFETEVSTSFANKFEGDKGGFNQGFSEKMIDQAIARHKKSLKKEAVKPQPKKAVKEVAKGKTGMKVRKDVYKYYESAVKINPALKDVRSRILRSGSLVEAMKVSEAFVRKQGDVSVKKSKVKESFSFQADSKKGWMLGSNLL